MTRALTEVGFYGKLPCRGDFLHRRVPADFVDAWDAWLQKSLHESQRTLQGAWLDSYLTGPVWRFVLAAGVCGDGAYAGILVPSVDRVGRYFPLTVIAKLEADDCLLDIACGDSDWLAAAELLVIDAIAAEALDFDAFDEQVALLRDRISFDAPLSLQGAVNAFAWPQMARTLQPLALWWSSGSAGSTLRWSITQGLPEPQAFAPMLSGEWGGAGSSLLANERCL
jgi:type VI secretion system protein ImpM